ncbi:MAG: hypothetical protein V4492_06490 [Chlamydiota bacterium]
MNFTREPIIETIISPRDGHKLVVRNSKGGGEEYHVDAVEVVSFGRAFFFRSMERPKPFLLPVSDYEVLEAKETRVALKNVSHERNIKIGGGRDSSHRPPPREQPQPKEAEPASAEEQPAEEETVLEAAIGSRMDKRRDRRRHRRRRGGDDSDWAARKPSESSDQETAAPQRETEGGGSAEDEAKVSSPSFTTLIPPPPTLISETIGRYKEKEAAEQPPKEVVEKPKPEKKEPPQDEPGADSSTLNRVSSDSLASTYFTTLPGGGDSFFF